MRAETVAEAPSVQSRDEPGPFGRLIAALPRGGTLPEDSWRRRHKFIIILLWVHVPLLFAFGLYEGFDAVISNAFYESVGPRLALLESGVIALFALLASWPKLSRRIRAVSASVGLVTCSAVLTQFSGGFIEAHFHFFVMLGIIAMYLDWIPFLLAVGYVAIHHGTVGTIAPTSVFNHPAAIASPWRWAFIHAFFILGLSVAQIAHWRMTENARARTESVLESAGDGILGIDDRGKLLFGNAAAAALLGREQASLIGQPFADAVPLRADTGQGPMQAIQEGRRMQGEGLIGESTGEVPVEWTANPVRHAEIPVGAVVTLRDISERRAAEEQRAVQKETERRLQQMEEQNEFKSRFINAAAHELNTPLTPINIYLRMLQGADPESLDPKHREAIEVLDRNFKRFSRLVGDLLDSARIQGGRLSIEGRRLDVGEEVVDEAMGSFRATAEDKGIELRSDVEPGLIVEADGQRLTQVLYNLLNNALKFTPEGGHVTVSAKRDGDGARIEVRDDGVGLEPKQIQLLFQPFSQVHDHKEEVQMGTGLGLYLSKAIIEQHQGRIWCESDGTGKGARFIVWIPLATAAPVPPAPQG